MREGTSFTFMQDISIWCSAGSVANLKVFAALTAFLSFSTLEQSKLAKCIRICSMQPTKQNLFPSSTKVWYCDKKTFLVQPPARLSQNITSAPIANADSRLQRFSDTHYANVHSGNLNIGDTYGLWPSAKGKAFPHSSWFGWNFQSRSPQSFLASQVLKPDERKREKDNNLKK